MASEMSAEAYRSLVNAPVGTQAEMDAASYQRLIRSASALVPEQPKQKYGAVPTEVDGIRFASKSEAKHYVTLRTLRDAGAITGLELQPRYPMVVNGVTVCTYVADFRYVMVATGTTSVVDVKGMKTTMYRLKKKLMLAVYGIVVEEVMP